MPHVCTQSQRHLLVELHVAGTAYAPAALAERVGDDSVDGVGGRCGIETEQRAARVRQQSRVPRRGRGEAVGFGGGVGGEDGAVDVLGDAEAEGALFVVLGGLVQVLGKVDCGSMGTEERDK